MLHTRSLTTIRTRVVHQTLRAKDSTGTNVLKYDGDFPIITRFLAVCTRSATLMSCLLYDLLRGRFPIKQCCGFFECSISCLHHEKIEKHKLEHQPAVVDNL